MKHTATILLMLAAMVLTACNTSDAQSEAGPDTNMATTDASKAANTAPLPSVLASMPSGAYTLDKNHGYISFSYSHFGYSNPQVGFRSFTVDLQLDANQLENSKVNVSIDANSIDSRVDEFNEHLRGEKLLDTAKFPTMTFTSTGVRVTGADTLQVTGDLTIKGVTKSVILDTRINKAAEHPMKKTPIIGVSASTKINRSEFDAGYVVPAVSDEVTITIETELPLAQ